MAVRRFQTAIAATHLWNPASNTSANYRCTCRGCVVALVVMVPVTPMMLSATGTRCPWMASVRKGLKLAPMVVLGKDTSEQVSSTAAHSLRLDGMTPTLTGVRSVLLLLLLLLLSRVRNRIHASTTMLNGTNLIYLIYPYMSR